MKIVSLTALLGAAAARHHHHRMGHEARLAFLNDVINTEDSAFIQTADPPEYGEISAYMDKSDANGGYERKVPERFTQERDDRLMNSIY